MITVIDVLRSMKVEPEKEVTWSLGARVRNAFIEKYGREPEKELRKKTGGGGSHCFAVYPASFRPTIENMASECEAEEARQMDLGL